MGTGCYLTQGSGRAFLTIPSISDCSDSGEGGKGELRGYLLEGHSGRGAAGKPAQEVSLRQARGHCAWGGGRGSGRR